ncbi:hypothetical protein FIE12Z_6106 [Fusarium flagelliforme]|uniref:C2H2-type domain-containing protein n=1 Tax=Fusarium flagelliforme TaxID=2675880 RepID=A0A395MRA9_9HYPO|nr:hypothetical protein FIE12Z_6106 [Fusarium flagelliforme]
MASLKNIMNTEDEPVDPRSESRSTDLTSRSSSVQSYVTSLNHQAPSSSHNNPPDPSEPSKSSSVLDHSSPTTTELNMNTRRRSNMSIDSNDMSYGSSQHDSSSNTSMRPFTASGSSETHVRWTPITGKISKAKKGVPVHKCHQCHKTFTRAEHLRRHQLSHSPPDLCCPVPSCNKTFYRKDLLDRHVQKHSQDGSGAKEPRQSPGPESSRPNPLPQAVTPHKPMLKPNKDFVASQPIVYRNVPGTWSPMAPTPSPKRNYNQGPEADGPGTCISRINYGLGPTIPVSSGSFSTNHHMLPGNVTPELQWQDNSATTSEFSTPPENARRPQFSVMETWPTPVSAYPTTNDMLNTMNHATYSVSYPYSNSTPPQVYPSVFPDVEVPLPVYNEDPSFGTVNQIPTSTVRSVSPSLAVAQSETLVAVPSLPTPGGTFNLAGCGSGTSGGEGLLNTEDLMPLSLSPAIKEAIPRYLEVYWDKVHPRKPIVHKHTYQDVPQEETEHVQALQCAMAALATQFIPIADDRMKGAQLHAYAWQQSKVFTHVGKWSMPVQQTIALCEYYARFRGRKSHSHQPSTEFTSLYPRYSANPTHGYDDKGLGSRGLSIMVEAKGKKGPQNHFEHKPGDAVRFRYSISPGF